MVFAVYRKAYIEKRVRFGILQILQTQSSRFRTQQQQQQQKHIHSVCTIYSIKNNASIQNAHTKYSITMSKNTQTPYTF